MPRRCLEVILNNLLKQSVGSATEGSFHLLQTPMKGKLIYLINRGYLDNHSLSQFFRRTHGRTLKIKASPSFLGLVTKQISNTSQRIKGSSFKWRTNPSQQLFDAWIPRRQEERYRSLKWECWGSSKTAKQGLGRLAMLAKQACAKGLFWGVGLGDT